MLAQDQLGQALVEIGLITESQLVELESGRRASRRRLVEQIVATNVATEDRIVTELSKRVNMDVVDPVRTPIHPQVLGLIDPKTAYACRMIPLARRKDGEQEVLFVVVADPFDGRPLDAIRPLVSEEIDIRFVLAGDSEILAALQNNYGPNRPDTVSAPPPRESLDHGVRFGGSAAEPLSASILPGDLLGAEATELAEAHPPRAGSTPKMRAVPVAAQRGDPDKTLESEQTEASSLPPQHVDALHDAPPIPVSTRGPTTPPQVIDRGPTAAVPPPERAVKRRAASPTEPVRAARSAPKADSVGDYALEERISVHGVAETWRARRQSGPSAGDSVHVRRMLPSLSKNERSRQRFFGAAQSLVDVEDTNVVRVIAAQSEDGEDFVVTEPAEGTDLERLLRSAADKSVDVPLAIALKIAQGIARGLRAAHAQGIHHLELSPRAVVVTRDGTVKVTDFGVASGRLEDRGRYVAPEQATGDGDARTDVYRLGLILYELLAGVPLVPADVKDPARAQEAVRQFRTSLAEARYDVSPAQEKLIAGALRPDPEKRHASVEVFLAAIDEELARSRTAASAASIVRFVDRVENAQTPEPQRLQDNAAEVLSSAAAAMKRVEERARPALVRGAEALVDTFDTFMASPTPIKIAVGVGAFLTLVVASAIVAVTMSSKDPEKTKPITIEDRPRKLPTKTAARDRSPPKVPEAAGAVELMPDVVDEPAPEGFAYAKVHGLELRATASDDGEVLFWLEVGQLVREMGEVEGKQLVLIPPRGPAGFVDADALTQTLPLEALARQVAFDDCSVTRKRTLDDCLYDAKQQQTACEDRCTDPSSRCAPMCELAFERCLEACRSSAETSPPPRRRRRRR
ncbi:MAG: protein kinase [Deltaproteobacteria bacterium]